MSGYNTQGTGKAPSLNIDGHQNQKIENATRGAEKPVLGGWCEARVTGLKAEDGSAAICWPLWRDCRVRVQPASSVPPGSLHRGSSHAG